MNNRKPALMILAVLTLVAVVGAVLWTSHKTSNSLVSGQRASKQSVLAMLDQLAVKNESAADYKRSYFGRESHGSTCKGTRVRVLMAESRVRVQSRRHCSTLYGNWLSAYDGATSTNPSKFAAHPLQLDHMVSLAQAWKSGAWHWSLARRNHYLNDLGYGPSLIMVSSKQNGKKHEFEPGVGKRYYLPPLVSYRCTFVAQWVAVKYRWSLSVDTQEKANLRRLLASCNGDLHVSIPIRVAGN